MHNLTDRCKDLGLCEVRERITLQSPTDIPTEEHPSSEAFLGEAKTLVAEAAKEDLLRRVMGGIAAYGYPQRPQQDEQIVDREVDTFLSYMESKPKILSGR